MIADTIDQNGFVPDVLVQSRRDFKGACAEADRQVRQLLRKLLKKHMRAPHVLITDKLNSYGTARRQPRPGSEHRQHKELNNHAEDSPQPAQRWEHQLQRFKSARQVQRFLCIHDAIASLFHLPCTVCPQARTMPLVPWRSEPKLVYACLAA